MTYVTVIGTVILSLAVLSWWLLHNPVADFSEHLPGMDNRPAGVAKRDANIVNIGSFFASFSGTPGEATGAWPRFRGADFDNISKETTKLAENWDAGGPPRLWSVELGEGHAGAVVSGGRVYVMDYDEKNRRDVLRCFSFDDGKEIWRRGYDIYVKRNHGMSRTVPAVQGNYIVVMGPMCQVMCVTADSGSFIWGLDVAREYESEVPLWYTGQCPLIDDSLAVIATGGKSLLAGISLKTGNLVWETPNPNNWKMSHSSVIPMTIYGTRMFVYSAVGGLVAVSADGEGAGQVLFETNKWNHNVVAPSPVYVGNGRIFMTSGYGAGSMMLQVKYENNQYSISPIQTLRPGQGISAEQQTPMLAKDHLFAILPKDAGPLRNQLVCASPDDCSQIIWSSGKTNRFGLGPYMMADDKLLILSDDGVLTVARASISGYQQLAQAKILDGHDAWGPLALVDGRLLARDSRRMVCVDLRHDRTRRRSLDFESPKQ
jgi:outer membrane protein assembly factor BamB